MKKPVFYFIIMLFFSLQLAAETSIFEVARQNASANLLDFGFKIKDLNSEKAIQIFKMNMYLKRAQFFAAPINTCKHGRVAYTVPYQRSYAMLFCAPALNMTTEELTQVLIHESVHMTGITDECQATALELEVTQAQFQKIYYKSDYVKSCVNQ